MIQMLTLFYFYAQSNITDLFLVLERRWLEFVTTARQKFTLQFGKFTKSFSCHFYSLRNTAENWYLNVILKEVFNLSIGISTYSFSQSNVSINIWFENWTRENSMSIRRNENISTYTHIGTQRHNIVRCVSRLSFYLKSELEQSIEFVQD